MLGTVTSPVFLWVTSGWKHQGICRVTQLIPMLAGCSLWAVAVESGVRPHACVADAPRNTHPSSLT